MKKFFAVSLVVLSTFCLTACDKETTSADDIFELPQAMKDCKMYRMSSGSGTVLYAIRCPLSSTSTVRTGKHPANVVVTETQENLEDLTPPEPPKPPKEKVVVNGKTFIEE